MTHIIKIDPKDAGGLKFEGPEDAAVKLAQSLRALLKANNHPSYLNDVNEFTICLEEALVNSGRYNPDYEPVSEEARTAATIARLGILREAWEEMSPAQQMQCHRIAHG